MKRNQGFRNARTDVDALMSQLQSPDLQGCRHKGMGWWVRVLKEPRYCKPESIHDGISMASERTYSTLPKRHLTLSVPRALSSRCYTISWHYFLISIVWTYIATRPGRPFWPNQRALIVAIWTTTLLRVSQVCAQVNFCAVTYRSPTLLIPTTTRSFLRQNSARVCASVTGSSLT